MGDAIVETEEYLIEKRLGAVNALKVAHHGSRTSSSREFLRNIAPSVSIISVGKRNRYGHPHPEILERLQSMSKVYRTDTDGAVRIRVFKNGTSKTSTPRRPMGS